MSLGGKRFTEEQKIKYAALEQLNTIKVALKAIKLTVGDVSDDMLQRGQIGFKALTALCLLHDVSLTLLRSKTYFVLNSDATTKATLQRQGTKWLILREPAIVHGDGSNLVLIENIHKPWNAISAYTIQELSQMAESLGIDLKTSEAKKKTKAQLYAELTLVDA